ncbi:sodium-coupled monocarboxylate transporter 1-like [Neocloeon triangulifer]|uniref:sodium-coupled monocarboxylate transporter 1-like n=1 Tax=Neocloeon triangulifer TaxID=2078957 RepID=UPI00286EB518|nr:sodium-coupled monocarboxylate transporter 1-like [Neocloeon triangulifer]
MMVRGEAETAAHLTSKYFSAVDYAVFGGMLLFSALIGIYFAFFAKQKQNTTNEYLMGGKSMGIFPISMSLIASYISGIALLGLPAEMYTFGTQYWMIVLPEIAVSFTMANAYIPVFYELNITSSYEYLCLRFNQPVRILGSAIFIIKMMLYIPLVIYVPALAFNQVTGINLHYVTPAVCIVCIFYTTLGGLKAVVWTDTLQTIIMFFGIIIVMILGTAYVGGFGVVFNRNAQSDRLEFFNFDPDPTVRHTIWSVCVGNYFNWLASCSVNQAMVQRCLAMPTIGKAKITVLILALGILSIVSMSCYTGLIIYAAFHDCDPVTTKLVSKPDQILPYFVTQIASNVPGLPGLFVSGVFSAALSSMSTGLNSITGVLYEDFVKPSVKKPWSEAKASFLMKVVVAVVGSICVALVFLVERMGAIIQVAKSLSGITAGALLGTFSLGMFFPWANSAGAMAGGISSMLLVAYISLGTQAHIASGKISYPKKPFSVSGCSLEQLSVLNNSTIPIIIEDASIGVTAEDVSYIFRLSYLYYTMIGVFTAIGVGLLVSFATGANKPQDVDPRFLSPVIRRYITYDAKQRQKYFDGEAYELRSVQKKLISPAS